MRLALPQDGRPLPSIKWVDDHTALLVCPDQATGEGLRLGPCAERRVPCLARGLHLGRDRTWQLCALASAFDSSNPRCCLDRVCPHGPGAAAALQLLQDDQDHFRLRPFAEASELSRAVPVSGAAPQRLGQGLRTWRGDWGRSRSARVRLRC